MDAIRTLLLERTLTVVLDPDRVANASTRPVRDAEIDKFEDELAQLGFVMSLDLAVTLRRLPQGTLNELRNWMVDTLAKQLGAHRPQVPLAPPLPTSTPKDPAIYLRRMLTWLATRAEQPCPWCGQTKAIAPLDPCGHLVCRACWSAGSYVGCPICHRRVAVESFVNTPAAATHVTRHDGELRLVHLGFDLAGAAQTRFARIVARPTPLQAADRAEIEVVIDAIGPAAALWLPPKIPVKGTMAIAIARLWMVAPNRSTMVRATLGHLATATDVLRVACVLMGGDADLAEPMRLESIGRDMRRAIVEALDRLPSGEVVEDVARRVGLWKRIGERIHPYEWADRYPNAAVAFAVVRETELASASFGASLRERARSIPSIAMGPTLRVASWGGPIEDGLRRGDPLSALDRLAQRPGELLRRADTFVRASQGVPTDLRATIAAIEHALPRGAPATLLTLASHLARRTEPWPRRVFFPGGRVLRAWTTTVDDRPPLDVDAIATITRAVRDELIARASVRRHVARAVIDRALADLRAPIGGRTASSQGWPRGSSIALPDGDRLRVFVHWAEPTGTRVDLDLAVVVYDAHWRYLADHDFTNAIADVTAAPAPAGATELVDLDLAALRAGRARHAAVVVFSFNSIPFDTLAHGFVGLAPTPAGAFDPHSAQRFDLHGAAPIAIPLAIDLDTRRAHFVDVALPGRGTLDRLGGFHAAVAHLGRDLEAFGAGRPTLWDAAAIHAAARANIIYVRERDRSITTYRRRDGETAAARLDRILAGAPDDGRLGAIPTANAPTWLAVVSDDFSIPMGSVGYIVDSRSGSGDGIERLAARDLVDELAVISSTR
jgi:hypothetical protein